MSGPGGITCATCVFIDTSGVRPFCRHSPPQLVVVRTKNTDDDGVRKLFPVMDLSLDWCGQHSAGDSTGLKQ